MSDRVETRKFRAMGSNAHLVIYAAPAGLSDWAEAEVNRLERLWSRFLADSDLSRLNNAAGTGPHRVHPMTFAVIRAALALQRQTDGLFDPTVLDALAAQGYDRSFRELDRELTGATPPSRPVPGISGITLDPHGQSVTLPAGVHLDLGGIGKGFAADLVAEGLIDRGATGAAVGLGGDVRVRGRGPEDGGSWAIPVVHPLAPPQLLATHRLADDGPSAIVTSTRLLRTWRRAGVELHHLIDPRTGTSAVTALAAVVVAGREAASSEALAKAALIAGPNVGQHLLAAFGVHAWLAHADGTIDEVGG